MDTAAFAQRIRERFPEGLTGIFDIGGTRTTYILEQQRHSTDPGHIEDFADYSRFLQRLYRQFILSFYQLGGQNMIITATAFRGFYERGEEYNRLISEELLHLIDDEFIAFYIEHKIDPYITGIDVFFKLDENSVMYRTAEHLAAFNQNWTYGDGRKKLIWDIASIPLYSIWQLFQNMSDSDRVEINAELDALDNLIDIHRFFYKRLSKWLYSTELPMPHFYLGTNKGGDLKLRAALPVSLTAGEYMRMFYTPYPTLFTTPETLQVILNNLAFTERFRSASTDYRNQYSQELAQTEYERIMTLRSNPETTLGLLRKITT